MEGSASDGIFHFEVGGRKVLGFDTGLTPQAFAKARLGSLMSQGGLIVDSAVHGWNLEGTLEYQGHMVFYGADVPGESLETLLSHSDDNALLALQRYLKALAIIAESNGALLDTIALFPAGVLIGSDGSVFFAPSALAKRVYEYQDPLGYIERVLQWGHPDKTGVEAATFTAASLSYRLFTGTAPFALPTIAEPEKKRELLFQDIRDGRCKGAHLVSPSLMPEIAATLDRILCAEMDKPSPTLGDLIGLIGEPGSKKIADFYITGEAGKAVSERELQEYNRRERRIGVQRFLKKYKYVMMAGFGTALALFIIARSIITDQQKRPTTKGLSPQAVAESYYKAFNTLDHQWMDACVRKGIGKGDIEAVMNLFVISRVREAYERKVTVLDPETWKSQGSPATDATVFGITNLKLLLKTEIPAHPDPGDSCSIEATYDFYYPEQAPSEQSRTLAIETRKDSLTLEWEKDRWKIVAIERRVLNPQSDTP